MTHSLLITCKEVIGDEFSSIQVIPFGVHKTAKGTFIHDEESQDIVTKDFNKLKRDTVIDYEHQTLTGQEAPAAGWIRSGQLISKGKSGTWANVGWTDRAKEYIKNKEYRYVSPVFWVRDNDKRVVKLINVGLTNQPNLDGMAAITNKLDFKEEEDVEMKELIRLLGLAEESTEEQVMEAVKSLLASIESMKQKGNDEVVANKVICEALGLKEKASESEVKATIIAMKQGSDNSNSLAGKITELQNKLAAIETEGLVEMAMKSGKIMPSQKEWAKEYAMKDNEGFKVFIEKAPVVVPMGDMSGQGKKKSGNKALEASQIAVNKMLGITEESFQKYRRD